MRNDPKVTEAADALMRHFVNKKGKPIRTPYYQHQLQVLYENDYFEWIVTAALGRLAEEGRLAVFNKENVPELGRLEKVSGIKFYANPDAVRTNPELENMKRHVMSTSKLIERYSDNDVAGMLGEQLESLVENQLRISQFEIKKKHANEYDGKKWEKTNHNLDFIAKKRGKDFVIGVEVKNTLATVDPREIDTKIDICKHLGIVPAFAVRWNKPYLECIRRQGGFSWFFKTQIFPYGQEKFTRQLFTRLSAGSRRQFPVTVRNSLPERAVRIFNGWVRLSEDNPPEINTAYRCKKPPSV